MKLNLGCGGDHKAGYINVDIDPTSQPDLVADVLNLPYQEGGVDEIVAEHLLEHLTREEGLKALAHWSSLLKPGGIIEIETPDIKRTCYEFSQLTNEEIKKLHVNFNSPAYEIVGRVLNIYGNQRDPWQFHKWGYWLEYWEAIVSNLNLTIIDHSSGKTYHEKEEPCLWIRLQKLP